MGTRTFSGGSGGRYVKWNEDGMVISGLIKDFVKEKFGLQGIIDTGNGEERQFPMTAGLVRCFNEAFGSLKAVPNDVEVEIHYEKEIKLPNGNRFKRFHLCLDEDAYDLWCKATGFDPDAEEASADTVGF